MKIPSVLERFPETARLVGEVNVPPERVRFPLIVAVPLLPVNVPPLRAKGPFTVKDPELAENVPSTWFHPADPTVTLMPVPCVTVPVKPPWNCMAATDKVASIVALLSQLASKITVSALPGTPLPPPPLQFGALVARQLFASLVLPPAGPTQ